MDLLLPLQVSKLLSSDALFQAFSLPGTDLIDFVCTSQHYILAADALSDGLHQFWYKVAISLVSERWHCCDIGSVTEVSDLIQG